MLSSDTRVAEVKTEQLDSQSIIYEMSLFTLLEVRHRLKIMAENGEIAITTAELNRSLCFNLQKLATALEQQIKTADLWQTDDKCPQCELKIVPFSETCICGCQTDSRRNLLEIDDLNFLIPENCTE